MSLSGQQRRQLQSALIDAFPTTASLEQMLLYELDKNLRAIAGEGSLQDVVFKLIQTADSQGWLVDLVCAARKQNPGNSQLEVIASTLFRHNPTLQPPNVPQISPPTPYPQSASPTKSNAWKVFIGLGITAPLILSLVFGYESLTNIPLKSERGVDYTRLRTLLTAQKWREADEETAAITRSKILGLSNAHPLYIKDIETFPCTDLRTIEQLWLKYSDKRFGFSQQKQLWESIGGLPIASEFEIKDNSQIFNTFKEKVGWTKVISENNAPKGYFPYIEGWWGAKQPGWLEEIFSRVDACKADI